MASDYIFMFHGQSFTPNGKTDAMLDPDSAHQRNLETERKEIEWLKTGPDNVFLYVKDDPWRITTWLGTAVATHVTVGRSVYVGGIAGRYARKRSVDCRIFGVRYTGWYYESAGDYCRLKKAKRQ